jgi:hypothetical protein
MHLSLQPSQPPITDKAIGQKRTGERECEEIERDKNREPGGGGGRDREIEEERCILPDKIKIHRSRERFNPPFQPPPAREMT